MLVTILVVFVAAAVRGTVEARGLIRDTEVETIIRSLGAPLFGAAGLNADNVRIYIINDDALNAFVANGQALFLFTGLLMRTEGPGQLAGVIAHETGHIAGGHLARTSDAMRNASNAAILAMVLGAAAAVASGRGDAAVAVIQGGTAYAQQTLLSYSRGQEQSADQAGVNFLEATGQSARGMLKFFEILEGQELLAASRQPDYLRTHPITQDRTTFVRDHVARSKFSDVPPDPQQVALHRRMVAKLVGFIDTPAQTLRKYPLSDTSFAARYARAIASYRQADMQGAVRQIDELIAENPADPYLHELRGQVLFESGKPPEALVSYRKAHELLPKAALIELELARVELAMNTPEHNKSALAHLEHAVPAESDAPSVWRQLATAQGRTGDEGMAALSLAEEAVRQNRVRDALLQAKRAQAKLPRGTPGFLRALDIEQLAKQKLDK